MTPSKTQEEKDMVPLYPVQQTLELAGEMSYSESNGAWNILRLKKDILKEFPQLKEKQGDFIYKMTMHRSYKDLRKAIQNIEKSSAVIPILLFLYKTKKELNV